jgi:hypothetical protein
MNADGGVSYHCFNCNFKASYVPGRHLSYKFRKLLTWLGADENTVRRLVIEAVRIKDLVAPEQLEQVAKEEIIIKARPLPENAKTFENCVLTKTQNQTDFANAVEYTYNRGVDIKKYNLMWTDETAYNLNKRVIIPFTWQNQIVGYTARTFVDTVKPKYHSSYEPNYVFNVDQQSRGNKFVVVCEGPFDAMAIDGVAVLSNECSETQADIIDSLAREVIVVPDRDSAGARLVDAAIEYGWSVSFPVWQETCKDVAEAVSRYGRLFVLKAILEAKQTSKLKIELYKKKLYN